MKMKNRHRNRLKRRRIQALGFVWCYRRGFAFRADFGFFRWVIACLKASICLIFGLEDDDTSDKECLVSYDEMFNFDHYDWLSVFVNPYWFKKWSVSIVFDGE